MSNVIQFLESMGRSPLSATEYAASVASFDINEGQKRALLDRDHAALSEQMGGAKKMVFAIMAADEEA